MRTLYVSDLDGTLLRSDERTSGYTNRTVNRLVGEGMLFSYATARSFQTARKVTAGLEAEIPLIVYNGAAVADNRDGSFLQMDFFGGEAAEILDELEACGVFPIVYAVAGGREMFSYLPARCTRGMRAFLETRKNDRRANPVATRRTLRAGDIFYFTCIDEREKLLHLYEKYREQYHCVFQVDLYTREQWLEIMPKAASKASAALWLKSSLGCGRLVVFGDEENDVDLFEAADEAYAVANAADVLKAVATGVIGANDEDGVARWLDAHARCAAQTQGGV